MGTLVRDAICKTKLQCKFSLPAEELGLNNYSTFISGVIHYYDDEI